jgi:hypothetical protein
MALFEFDLCPVEDLTPWGEPGRQSLSWFALTYGIFRVVVGEQILFRYTPDLLSRWREQARDAGCEDTGRPDADYQIAAFARDILGSVAAGVAPLPHLVESLAADWELLTQLERQPRESGEEDSEDADDRHYAAWRWLGERSPWTSYLVAQPRLSFVRIGDEVRIHWDNRDRVIEGIPVWTAQHGVHALPVEVFLSECRSFADRLLDEMDGRISRIEAGAARPQVGVDIPSLREQQDSWRKELMSCFNASNPDIAWERTETALRAIATSRGIELPG